MSIEWLESEERFNWTPRIPLDASCRTLSQYIRELQEAVDYRRSEIGHSGYSWNNTPYNRYKFLKGHYDELKEQIDWLVVQFGYDSVEDSELLGRPWSELVNRGDKYEWDKELLNDFREVLDKLVMVGENYIYILDYGHNRILSLKRNLDELILENSWSASSADICIAASDLRMYGIQTPSNPGTSWAKTMSTWLSYATRSFPWDTTLTFHDTSIDYDYVYQMYRDTSNPDKIEFLTHDLDAALAAPDLTLVNYVQSAHITKSPVIVKASDLGVDREYFYLLIQYRWYDDTGYPKVWRYENEVWKINKSLRIMSKRSQIQLPSGWNVRFLQGLCVDSNYIYAAVSIERSSPLGYKYLLQKYSKSSGAFVSELQISAPDVQLTCDNAYLYTLGEHTYDGGSEWNHTLVIRNKDLSEVSIIYEIDGIKFGRPKWMAPVGRQDICSSWSYNATVPLSH
ncbi:MAG: hypothetical protein ACFFAU_01250 [Candidatus Hodarchaeota archaeon]